jgi:hypothetical protein
VALFRLSVQFHFATKNVIQKTRYVLIKKAIEGVDFQRCESGYPFWLDRASGLQEPLCEQCLDRQSLHPRMYASQYDLSVLLSVLETIKVLGDEFRPFM